MRRTEFRAFEAGQRFQFIPDLTTRGRVNGEKAAPLAAGTYEVVLDNSGSGPTSPPSDTATARVDFFSEAAT